MSHYLYMQLQFFTQDVKIGSGIEIQFLLDTGASISVINLETFQEIKKLYPIVTYTKLFSTYMLMVAQMDTKQYQTMSLTIQIPKSAEPEGNNDLSKFRRKDRQCHQPQIQHQLPELSPEHLV